jgi:uncharacterized membrane protein
MKYTSEITINRPIQEVIEKFDNIDNMKEWMSGFVSYEIIEGIPGQEGAKMKLFFDMGKRKIEMIETITKRNLPHEFSGTYDAKGVQNIVKNFFEKIDENTTNYKTEQEFHFSGFMKIIGMMFPKMFKKQTYKYLEDFKKFVEKN